MILKSEYIEFQILDKAKFQDLKRIYRLIAQAKNKEQPKENEFWRKVFPDYVLKHFIMMDNKWKPTSGATTSTEEGWCFYSIIDLLQTDLDVEYLDCKEVSENYGVLEFSACGYPYGGIEGLTMFLNSFDCKASVIDEGGGVYKVKWTSDKEFELHEITNMRNNSICRTIISKPLGSILNFIRNFRN